MSPEVRRAALLIAAKATIFTAIGCSGGLQPAAGPAPTSDPPAAADKGAPAPAADVAAAESKTCAQHLDGLVMVKNTSELPDNDPLRGDMTVYGAFADVAARSDPRTQECCREELKQDVAGAPHRWACCSALGDSDPEVAMACTPWGPPCPPALLA